MQSATRLAIRRCYSTTAPVLPTPEAARTASTPRAVRLRRLRVGKGKPLRPALVYGETDATESGLTPTEHARYQRLIAVGRSKKGGGVTALINPPSEEKWLQGLNKKRARIRGMITRLKDQETGELHTEAIGQKVYLPNIIFRLVRNHTPKGEPYNPYEATFRIPQSVTKTDVRSYLWSTYGVKTTYIRTDNYISPVSRDPKDGSWSRTQAHKTYKRAVVGLVDPFYYPLALEHMEEAERADREKWIENMFGIKAIEDQRKYELLRLTKSGSKDWKWRGSLTLKRSAILKLVAEKRAAREAFVEDYVQGVKRERKNRQPIPPPVEGPQSSAQL